MISPPQPMGNLSHGDRSTLASVWDDKACPIRQILLLVAAGPWAKGSSTCIYSILSYLFIALDVALCLPAW